MTFRMTLNIEFGPYKRSFDYESPEGYPSDFEQTVAHTFSEFRDMLTQIMPAGFSDEATERSF